MTNPFKQTMVKLKQPEGFGGSVSVAGFLLDVDDQGCIEVPGPQAVELKAHGWTEPGAPVKPAKK